jgi:hypothetical protein
VGKTGLVADDRRLWKCFRYFPDGAGMIQMNMGQQDII